MFNPKRHLLDGSFHYRSKMPGALLGAKMPSPQVR